MVPTVERIVDGIEEDEDGPYEVSHLECRLCHERIEPRYTADATTQHVPGLRWFKIDGRPVSEEEFMAARQKAAQ